MLINLNEKGLVLNQAKCLIHICNRKVDKGYTTMKKLDIESEVDALDGIIQYTEDGGIAIFEDSSYCMYTKDENGVDFNLVGC